MHVNQTDHSTRGLTHCERDLEEMFDEQEAQLLIEGLSQLRMTKQQALSVLQAERIRPGGRDFEPHDFGLPMIDSLLKRLGREPFEEPTEAEER